jgi:transcription termination/antitermination protein NusG
MFNDFNYMSKKFAERDGDLDLMDIDVNDNDNDRVDIHDNHDDDDNDGNDEINDKNNGKNIKLFKDKNKVISTSKEESIKDNKKIKHDSKLSNGKSIKSTSLVPQQDKTVSDSEKDDFDSKFFVVRVSGGQESLIASMLHSKLSTKKVEGIYSILFLDHFKGYVIVEAVDSNMAYEALHGIRHIRGQIRGELPFKDLEGYLIKKPVVTELIVDDTVEIVAGPFKSMKAKIMRVDYEKQEATVVLLDSPYQIPVTVDANYLKKIL